MAKRLQIAAGKKWTTHQNNFADSQQGRIYKEAIAPRLLCQRGPSDFLHEDMATSYHTCHTHMQKNCVPPAHYKMDICFFIRARCCVFLFGSDAMTEYEQMTGCIYLIFHLLIFFFQKTQYATKNSALGSSEEKDFQKIH